MPPGTSLDLPFIYRVESGFEEHGPDLDCLEVCKISGCRDYQTSADAYINDKFLRCFNIYIYKDIK